MNKLDLTIRLLLSILFGGIIGIERESVNRPAGFRTHILVCEEEVDGNNRVVLRFKPEIAPIKCAVLPLSKKAPIDELSKKVYKDLKKYYNVEFDNTGSIGRRYRRQDEIGTPFAITVDFESLEDNKVTIRDRDTMQQDRIEIEKIRDYLVDKLGF